MPGTDGGYEPSPGSCARMCAVFGIVCLLLLSGAAVPGMPMTEALCPIVVLPGLFGPNGSSFLRYWIRRCGETGGRDDPGASSPDAPVDPPLSKRAMADDGTSLV